MSQPGQVSDRLTELNTRLRAGWVAHRTSGGTPSWNVSSGDLHARPGADAGARLAAYPG